MAASQAFAKPMSNGVPGRVVIGPNGFGAVTGVGIRGVGESLAGNSWVGKWSVGMGFVHS